MHGRRSSVLLLVLPAAAVIHALVLLVTQAVPVQSASIRISAEPRPIDHRTPTSHPADQPRAEQAADGELLLLALPVGQGDSTVLVCPEHNGNVVIFDMGSTASAWTADDVRVYLETTTLNGDRPLMDRLSTIVISHAHTDHYNYIPQVFPLQPNSTYDKNDIIHANGANRGVGHGDGKSGRVYEQNFQVFVSGQLEDYAFYDMEAWLRAAGAELFNGGQECFMSECYQGSQWTERVCGDSSPARFLVVAANMVSGTGNKNEQSVVLRVSHGNHDALLVGDFEGPSQTELVNRVQEREPGLLLSDIYKVSHHGASNLANYLVFLEAVQARTAFVSSAYPGLSQYGHPKCEAIYRLLSVGTLLAAPAHRVDCTDAAREVVHLSLEHRVYGTMPLPGQTCLVQLALPAASDIPLPQLSCTATTATLAKDKLGYGAELED